MTETHPTQATEQGQSVPPAPATAKACAASAASAVEATGNDGKQPVPVVFFGSDAIALPLLRWLHEAGGGAFTLCGVISQPDRKSGRGQKLQPNPISAYALEAGIPLLRPQKPDAELEAWLQAQQVQLALVMAYGHLLRKSLLAVPPRGFVNFHASVLPHYRGASPVESAVACAESQTGVSLMQIVPRMDAGPVLGVETVCIDHARAETGADIRHKLASACVPLIARHMCELLSGAAASRFAPQDEARASYCRKLDKTDGQLDFNASTSALAARINGLYPWPGCYLDYAQERFKVAEAFAETLADPDAPASPGTILSADKNGLRIRTGQGVLRICRLQKAGGKMLPADAFFLGTPFQPGQQVQGGAMRPLTQPSPRWDI